MGRERRVSEMGTYNKRFGNQNRRTEINVEEN